MSAKNGDKSRFGRLRKQRILQRSRVRELRRLMGRETAKTAKGSSPAENKTLRETRPQA